MAEGHSSQVLALSEKAGVPLAESQDKLTPLQRHVLALEMKKQQEEAQEETSGSGRSANPMRQPHGGGSGQTTTYVNENYQ